MRHGGDGLQFDDTLDGGDVDAETLMVQIKDDQPAFYGGYLLRKATASN